jgi:hypothetical protein
MIGADGKKSGDSILLGGGSPALFLKWRTDTAEYPIVASNGKAAAAIWA